MSSYISPQMIHQAQARSADAPNIDFQVADALVWECSPEQFDYIVSIAALHHLPMEEVLSKLKRWLAPGGSLVILDIYQTRFSDLFVDLAAVPANVFMQRLKNGHRPPSHQKRVQRWLSTWPMIRFSLWPRCVTLLRPYSQVRK